MVTLIIKGIALSDAKMFSCLESIQDVVGDTIPEEVIVRTVKHYNYNVEAALNHLLTNPKQLLKKPQKVAKGKACGMSTNLQLVLQLYCLIFRDK